MAAAKQALVERLAKCHLVLEVRDARVSTHARPTSTTQLLWSVALGTRPCDATLILMFDMAFCV